MSRACFFFFYFASERKEERRYRRERTKEDSHLAGETKIRLLLSATVLPDRFEAKIRIETGSRRLSWKKFQNFRVDAVVTTWGRDLSRLKSRNIYFLITFHIKHSINLEYIFSISLKESLGIILNFYIKYIYTYIYTVVPKVFWLKLERTFLKKTTEVQF